MWTIKDNTIRLAIEEGKEIYPLANQLFAQKDFDSYTHEDKKYAPLSDLNIRFSIITAHAQIKFIINESVSIILTCKKADKEIEIGKHDNSFVDYVIDNNVCKYVGTIADSLNEIIRRENINIDNVSYIEYASLIKELEENNIDFIDEVSDKIKEISNKKESVVPKGLKANLYPYQQGGSSWLNFMVRNKCGCILADEMGLGKTLQVISVIGLMKERKNDIHCLVICPLSLLENWRREILKFYPGLSTYVHYGQYRTGDYHIFLNYDVTILSYSSVYTDSSMLDMITWDIVVIDEAQNIKNPKARRTKAVKEIKRNVSIAVTGTPFENHISDLWSLLDFVVPGYLGPLGKFCETFNDDVESAKRLEKYLSPFMLRRRVKEVAKDLPERIDIPQPVIMTDEEAKLYEDERTEGDAADTLKSMSIDKIQKLRTFCTHPCVYNYSLDEIDPVKISNKYMRLCEILEEIFEVGEKVIIFTSFRKMIELLVNDINDRFGVYTNFIDGSVTASERQKVVDQFSDVKGAGALILNPKAAGAGLNITCANHAIHYNLEWNPAVEDQASARVYRRGQKKKVFIYRLYYVDTIEEIINEKINIKRTISDNAVVGNEGITDSDYIIKALTVSPYKK